MTKKQKQRQAYDKNQLEKMRKIFNSFAKKFAAYEKAMLERIETTPSCGNTHQSEIDGLNEAAVTVARACGVAVCEDLFDKWNFNEVLDELENNSILYGDEF